MRPLILVTGFGPFFGHTINPSEPLAEEIASIDHPTHDFAALAPLPVELERAAELTCHEAQVRGAVAVLSLGMLATCPRVRIESVARNRVEPIAPDVTGRRVIVDGAPEMIRSPLDLGALARSLDANGIEWEPSDDAGTYVCNDLYFRVLEAHARETAPPAAFVHVPIDAHEMPRLADALAEGMVHAMLSLPSARFPRG